MTTPGRSRRRIAVRIDDRAWLAALPQARAVVRRAAGAALGALGQRDVELAALLTDDTAVRELNRAWRGKDKATDVLSFPLGEPGEDGLRHLGDVILARETVVAAAHERGLALADHVTHLMVHGVLHLLGHDHEKAAEARRMEMLETQVLAALGVADPYRRAA